MRARSSSHLIHLDPGYTEPRDAVRLLRFHPDGRSFVALVGEPESARELCWWNLPRDARTRLLSADDEEYVRELPPDPAVSRDLELVAHVVEDYDGGVRVRVTDTWANPTEEKFPPLDPEREPPLRTFSAVAFTPDGGRVLCRQGAVVVVWEVDPWRVAATLAGDAAVTDVAASPDGRRLLTAAVDGTVTAWDADTYRVVGRYDWGVGGLHAVAFAPDGLTAAAGGERGRVVVWDFGE